MERTIIFATGNLGKMKEIRMILADYKGAIVSMKEAGILLDIVEDGTTFEENAMIKAKAVKEEADRLYRLDQETYALCKDAIVLADDSGLEVDFLNKEPGIYSARYLGEDTSYDVKNRIIMERLEGVPEEERSARFVCAIAAVTSEDCFWVKENMEGRIAYEAQGKNGFGYDPIFYLPEYGCTSAQLSPKDKNACSHRGKALRAMKNRLLKETVLG